ncbi:hypothetical protein GLOIN_2v1769123 [Rhizophagus irregularis DAOM 181602=DAOM 197198]|nr:hypothetical protein GLOIN_2v1769123 [Rhizophagus irregularis DAOM 181602=DAOM 197198]
MEGWKKGFCKEEPRFVRCLGRASEEWKNLKIQDRVDFRRTEKGETKVRKFRVGLQSLDKAEPRFVSGGFPKSEKRRTRFVVLPGQSFEE